MKILVASHTYIVDLNCEKYRLMTTLEPNIDVTLVVPKRWRPGGVQRHVIHPKKRLEGNFRVIPVSNLSEKNQPLLTFGLDLVQLLWKFRPDIIQVEQGAKSLAYAELIVLNRLLGLNAKRLFFTWWNLPYTLHPPLSWLEAFNLRHTDGLVAGNQDAATILRDRGYTKPFRVIPQLGVDESRFFPEAQPELAQLLDLPSGDFVVGYVGRFVEEKGLMTLASALAQLRNYRWTWLLVGRGPLQEAILTWAQVTGLGDRLRWVDSVPHDEVPRYINLMNVLVLPSQNSKTVSTLTAKGWKEQFGHVLIEAMACQVPVIGSNSGEIPQVIADAGLVFPEGDASALSDRLLRLMAQPQLATALAKRGYQRALQRYTNRAIAQQQLAFYHELLSNPTSVDYSV